MFINQPPNFPNRKDLKKTNQESLIEQIKSVNLENIDYSKLTEEDYGPNAKVTQEQKTFFWVRVRLYKESILSPDQNIDIVYRPSGEILSTRFVCYEKKGLDKDGEQEVVNYNAEDDKKVLCLMIDMDKINYHNEDIPFIKTLFRCGKYYEPQLIRKNDLQFLDSSGNVIDYYDAGF